jgi:pimeloyl-ACP methyl ester carboxylesterase
VYQDDVRAAGDADRAVLSDPAIKDMLISFYAEPFREGINGMYWDRVIPARDWGFRLREITAPVRLWYGEQDEQAPPAVSRYLAGQLPNAQLTLIPREGHLIVYTHWGEMLAALTKETAR